MAIIDSFYASLKQEGYAPHIGEGGVISFKYFGQECALRLQTLGTQVIAELECQLPRPAQTAEIMQGFADAHPLARLGARSARTVLFVTSLIGERDAGPQITLMLELLGLYTADLMFGAAPQPGAAAAQTPVAPAVPVPITAPLSAAVPKPSAGPIPVLEASLGAPPAPPQTALHSTDGETQVTATTPPPAPDTVHPAEPRTVPPAGSVPLGWESFWPLMNERYHPLALALARLGVPVPSDVQVDMMQGHQVRGTAIMLWQSSPEAVVICEPGQMVPNGYLGGTWLRHFTVDQVAASIQHNLRKVGLL